PPGRTTGLRGRAPRPVPSRCTASFRKPAAAGRSSCACDLLGPCSFPGPSMRPNTCMQGNQWGRRRMRSCATPFHGKVAMAAKATVFKAELSVSDMDRHYYATHQLTLAQHPSETEERLMVRLLAFALNAGEQLAFGRGISNTEEEPDLWARDYT